MVDIRQEEQTREEQGGNEKQLEERKGKGEEIL